MEHDISAYRVRIDLDATEKSMRENVSELMRSIDRERRGIRESKDVDVGMVSGVERLSDLTQALERATGTLHTLQNLNSRNHVECEKKDNLLVCEGDRAKD